MVENQDNKDVDSSIKLGKFLAHPPPNEEVVISGMSGIFPKAKNIDELQECLYNKIDMITPINRFGFFDPELPKSAGTINNEYIRLFDSGYFGLHENDVDLSDPLHRLVLEKVVEAIMDAGLHPSDLENTRTGLFMGSCAGGSDTGIVGIMSTENVGSTAGFMTSMMAAKTAYLLRLNGPAVMCDTACSSSLFALENAYNSMRLGECDNAIVTGTNLCLYPGHTVQFSRLGVLSDDGHCKSFEKEGKGYVRAESVCAIILQKSKDAKRIYAQIVHSKTNTDGFKEYGITYPSGDDQYNLLRDVYEECNISPTQLSYVEAHGTGTPVGDPEECRALEKVFVPGRTSPLLIGSVKSNLGHSEPTSGLNSIIKCILALETGIISPNLHYNTPRPSIPALVKGSMEVTTEVTKFRDENNLIGINSFGFGGANCHVLLKGVDNSKPSKMDNLPRLVCISGRTEEAVASLLDDVSHRELNTDHIGLLHNIFRKNVPQHIFRGYSIISRTNEICRSIHRISNNQKKVHLIFGEVDNWYQIAENFNRVPLFKKHFQRIVSILNDLDLTVKSIFSNVESNRKANNIFGGAIVLICIADMLKELNISTVATMGYGYGELVCAYYDTVIDIAELIRCIYTLNREINQNGHLVYENGVNASELKNQEVLLTKTPLELRQTLKSKFNDILLYPRVWKSTSIRKRNATADYFTDASLKWTNEIGIDISKHKAHVLEIGSNDLQNIKNLENLDFISFRSFEDFLRILGRLYESGHNPQLAKLYPEINVPVNKGTPMISSKIKWLHNKTWRSHLIHVRGHSYTITIDLDLKEWQFISGHIIDGRNLYPAAGYLQLVWSKFITMVGADLWITPIAFEDCRFLTATTIAKKGHVTLKITISKSGYFEISDGNSLMVTGTIRLIDAPECQIPTVNYHISEKNSMNQRDIYKELSLRGYYYRREFRCLEQCNVNGTNGLIKWNSNWISFIDNMFQLKILGNDTRLLYVPTHLENLTIDPRIHYQFIVENSTNPNDVTFPISYNAATDTTRSGGVSVTRLQASSIQRKKNLQTPVLEKYEFIPNSTQLSIQESVRINMQIILENILKTKISTVELVDAATPSNSLILSPLVIEVLNDQPIIQPTVKIYSNETLDVDVPVENEMLKKEDEFCLVIGFDLFQRKEMLSDALEATRNNGYVISRENVNVDISSIKQNNVEILTVHRTTTECIIMVTTSPIPKQTTYINVTNLNFEWLGQVQSAIGQYEDVILYSENETLGGLLGFANCLRREPGCNNVRCLILDGAKPFSPDDTFYSDQLKKKMAVNIYKNGMWGTYRHLLLDQSTIGDQEHCYVSQTMRGDLSSLKWVEGPLNVDDIPPPEKELIKIYYASLNFRDIMTASGKINADVITVNRLEQECLQGFEFSGLTRSGERVMGLVSNGAMSSLTMADNHLLWPIPDNWSLEEAASVPVVYGTVIYALNERGNMKRGDSILIHSGIGGVGQAAIRYSLHHGCNVFTTVGSQSRKEHLREIFPELKENQIGNSHDLSFEQMVMKETNGEGVDIVLNSLAEDKLLTSVRCLRRGGRFLEIGKFDISSNNVLSLQLLKNDCSFHGVMLDKLFDANASAKTHLKNLVLDGIQKGSVKPLPRNVFKFDEVEKAFRFMAHGKHMGKVLIELQKEGENKFSISQFHAMPKYYCNRDQTYLIIGGLGGFGLEMVDWLVIRGARKFVLNSRNGIKNGYQRSRLRIWRRYGVVIKISTADVTKKEGCIQVIEETNSLGPINAIFNLAAVLQDAIFQNQTEQMFQTSLSPKAYATKYLDEVSREMCPELSHFVVFSSVSCGRGNAGQTNYGMANSVMERICEERRNCGLPALAIEWGAIGEVGLVADMMENNLELEISGTLQQRVASCLQVMDLFLRQKSATIVSSMVVAEKKTSSEVALTASDAVASILGIKDIKSVSPYSTLAELGMDSMTAVEIKQHLERDFDISLNVNELRTLTFAKLKEQQACDDTRQEEIISSEDQTMNIFQTIQQLLLNEEDFGSLEKRMETNIDPDDVAPTVLLIPGLEGFSRPFEQLARNLNTHAIGFNYDFDHPKHTIVEDVEAHLHLVEKYMEKDKPFVIVSHSYGSTLALEIASKLEAHGYEGIIISIDGAPLILKKYVKEVMPLTDKDLEIHSLMYDVTSEIDKTKETLLQCQTMEERIDAILDLKKNYLPFSVEWQKKIYTGTLQRIKALRHYNPSYTTIKSRVILCKPKLASFSNLPDDYNLSSVCGQLVEVRAYDGDHNTILENEDLAQYINNIASML